MTFVHEYCDVTLLSWHTHTDIQRFSYPREIFVHQDILPRIRDVSIQWPVSQVWHEEEELYSHWWGRGHDIITSVVIITIPKTIVITTYTSFHKEATKRLFVASDHCSLLWPKCTIFLKSQRSYSWSVTTAVCCGQSAQYSWSHEEAIRGQWPLQFVKPFWWFLWFWHTTPHIL